MFGHQADNNSRNWKYGARTPTENADVVADQMWKAHVYRNKLVELERNRRERVNEVTRGMDVAVDIAEVVWTTATAVAERVWQEIQAVHKAAHERGEDHSRETTREQRATLAEARKAENRAWKVVQAARREAWKRPEVRIALDQVDAADLAARKEARAACGLYWGTYLQVEQSLMGCRRGAPPQFARWRGDGKIAVQIQGGMPVEELWSGENSRVRLIGRERYARLMLRVQSEGRDPVWADIPIQLHRPFPEGSRVKWVYLLRRRIAAHDRWHVVFVLANAVVTSAVTPDRHGEVGVDPGWRVRPDGLRVAVWVDHDSDGEEIHELVISNRDLRRWDKADELQAIRKRNLNAALSEYRAWAATRNGSLPEWIAEATETVAQWRSAGRLAALVIKWRTQRFTGDDMIFSAIETWRKQDKHLWEWEANNRRKAVAWRDNLYREFACMLDRRYERLRWEDTNWRDLARRAEPQDEEVDLPQAVRHNRVIAAVGRLTQLLREKFGERADKAQARLTTIRCASCGAEDPFDASKELVRICTHCGYEEDQDQRAARNIRERRGEQSDSVQQPEVARV